MNVGQNGRELVQDRDRLAGAEDPVLQRSVIAPFEQQGAGPRRAVDELDHIVVCKLCERCRLVVEGLFSARNLEGVGNYLFFSHLRSGCAHDHPVATATEYFADPNGVRGFLGRKVDNL